MGPLVVPAARLDELLGTPGDGPLEVSLIAAPEVLRAAVDQVRAADRLVLAAVEVPPPADAAAAREVCALLAGTLPPGVPAAVELPRTPARDAVLDVLAAEGRRAKLRTGGLQAAAFPSAEELAGTLAACVSRGVPAKCTAGLHGALPHTDPATGFAHHGFLAVLLAVDVLAGGGSQVDAVGALRRTSGPEVAAEIAGWTAERAARARGWFTSFGTCSVVEPVEHLRSLGLLPHLERTPA